MTKVTIPVTPSVPIPCVKISLDELTPILYLPCKNDVVVVSPPIFTAVLSLKFIAVEAIPTNELLFSR